MCCYHAAFVISYLAATPSCYRLQKNLQFPVLDEFWSLSFMILIDFPPKEGTPLSGIRPPHHIREVSLPNPTLHLESRPAHPARPAVAADGPAGDTVTLTNQ